MRGLFSAAADRLGGDSGQYHSRIKSFIHHRARSHHTSLAHLRHDDRLISDPHIVSDFDASGVSALLRHGNIESVKRMVMASAENSDMAAQHDVVADIGPANPTKGSD